ncbi:MAG: LysM peptidoglycan-binding domain-containing protein [Ignavibacteria bacterium]|nr:LysM peptidoglycan-binding domain-containing protein [Ignavibacteria bacterium]
MKVKFFFLIVIGVVLLFVLAPISSYAQNETYEVVKGDCLWKISKKELKDGKLWPEIWVLNKDGVVNKDKFDKEKYKTIKNPNLIYPTQILRIPKTPKLSQAELQSAYKEAKKYWRKMHPRKPKVNKEESTEKPKDDQGKKEEKKK